MTSELFQKGKRLFIKQNVKFFIDLIDVRPLISLKLIRKRDTITLYKQNVEHCNQDFSAVVLRLWDIFQYRLYYQAIPSEIQS